MRHLVKNFGALIEWKRLLLSLFVFLCRNVIELIVRAYTADLVILHIFKIPVEDIHRGLDCSRQSILQGLWGMLVERSVLSLICREQDKALKKFSQKVSAIWLVPTVGSLDTAAYD